jgi:hypothetical protein
VKSRCKEKNIAVDLGLLAYKMAFTELKLVGGLTDPLTDSHTSILFLCNGLPRPFSTYVTEACSALFFYEILTSTSQEIYATMADDFLAFYAMNAVPITT